MIYGILLAAGDSRRYGNNKLIERLSNGKMIVENAGSVLNKCVDKAIAVVRKEDIVVADKMKEIGIEPVFCGSTISGMGVSLSVAVSYIQDAKGLVVALGDMPFIKKETIDKIVSYLRQNKSIVAPLYNGKRGHPVGFNFSYKNELCCLSGDRGAREILETHGEKVSTFESDDPGVLIDIDTKKDIINY